MVKNPPASAADLGSISSQEDPLEKEMATHSSILAWEIPSTEEHSKLQSIHRVTKSWTRLSDFTFTFLLLLGSCQSLTVPL